MNFKNNISINKNIEIHILLFLVLLTLIVLHFGFWIWVESSGWRILFSSVIYFVIAYANVFYGFSETRDAGWAKAYLIFAFVGLVISLVFSSDKLFS